MTSVVVFMVVRVFFLLIYKYPFSLYCGDSAYYLHLASHFEFAAADRPNGYPFVLSLFLPVLYRNWYTIPVVQMIFSFTAFVFCIKTLGSRKDRSTIFLWVIFVFSNFLVVYMEKSIMPDSIAFNLLVFGSLLIVSIIKRSSWKLLLIGIISGVLPIIRTNYLVFSLLIMCISIIKLYILEKISLKFIMKISCVVLPFLILYFSYVCLFVYPRLGVKKISSFGGRTLFSRVMVFTECNKLRRVDSNKEFVDSLITNCKDEELTMYNSILFSENGLIKKTDNMLSLDRAKTDSFYIDVSKKLIINNPKLLLDILGQSGKDILYVDGSFFRSNVFPLLQGGCESLPERFGVKQDDFNARNVQNYDNRLISTIGLLSVLSQKSVILFLFLLFPLWMLVRIVYAGLSVFVLRHWIAILVWMATIAYFIITLLFTGFDYRYTQPLWLALIWIVTDIKISSKNN